MATTLEQQMRRALGLDLAQAARRHGATFPAPENIAAPRANPSSGLPEPHTKPGDTR
jgi:hypothetical protein